MQIDYLFRGIKGFIDFQRVCYALDMQSNESIKRLKILKFYERYGLEVTLEAFDISKRTLYRWQAIRKEAKGDVKSLNPKSTAPHNKREVTYPKILVKEVKTLREKYPNIGKAKLHVMLQSWSREHHVDLPSESTIGRIIARDDDNMRFTPYRINTKGKRKPFKRSKAKNRKPKGLKSEPMHLWAVDTIQRVSLGIRRYIMTLVDPHSQIVAVPSKHSKHTAHILGALLDGLSDSIELQTDSKSFAILSDNGSEFMKKFDALLEERKLTHYWTYPKSPKMNAHNERFNRTIQEQFVDYYEDILFTDINLFNQMMADWLIDYNTVIPHHSLQMKTPVQYLIDYDKKCHMLWTNTWY